MIYRKYSLILSVIAAGIYLVGCKSDVTPHSNSSANIIETDIDLDSQIVVVIDSDFPGYFNYSNKNLGYTYDILSAYSVQVDLPIRFEYSNNPSETLESEGANMMLFLSHYSIQEPSYIELLETNYVILGSKREFRANGNKFSLEDILKDDRINIVISADFKSNEDYDKMLDMECRSSIFLDHRDPLALAQALSMGGYDYLICEKSEAQFICSLTKNVCQVFEFESENQINLVVSEDNPILQSFKGWFLTYKKSYDYKWTNHRYMNTGYAGYQLCEQVNTSKGRISSYDDLMRSISKEFGVDWRLLATMAEAESKFNPYMISPMGAKGLMQIMPIVAREFKEKQEDVMKIDINIMLAAKLLVQIERMLNLPDSMPESDKLKVILAGYNAGVGHLLDAMRLADKYGTEPNSWSDISLYLQSKTADKYASDDVVKSGTFNGGGSTIAYVNTVFNRYSRYQKEIKR